MNHNFFSLLLQLWSSLKEDFFLALMHIIGWIVIDTNFFAASAKSADMVHAMAAFPPLFFFFFFFFFFF